VLAGQTTSSPRKITRRARDLAAGVASVLAAAFAWDYRAGVAAGGIVLITGGVAAGME
jgi:hypothetical protein